MVDGGDGMLERVLCRMSAIVDLHGAPGSQNGFDNSGYAGPILWPEPANVNRTIYDIGLIASKVVALNQQTATLNVVVGLELLNEPKSTYVCLSVVFFCIQFYEYMKLCFHPLGRRAHRDADASRVL